MKITMDGKYAYRGDTRKQVRILCVDRENIYPVVALGPRGDVSTHTLEGFHVRPGGSGADLVELDESLTVTPGTYRTRDGSAAAICYIRKGAEFAGHDAVGWFKTPFKALGSWRLDGRFSDLVIHQLDLIERIGDLP